MTMTDPTERQMAEAYIALAREIVGPFVETDGEGDVDSEGLLKSVAQAIAQAERRGAEAQREADANQWARDNLK